MDAIFKALSEKVIPLELHSKMPILSAEARKIISDVGLDYKVYHSCPCDLTLYYRPLKRICSLAHIAIYLVKVKQLKV